MGQKASKDQLNNALGPGYSGGRGSNFTKNAIPYAPAGMNYHDSEEFPSKDFDIPAYKHGRYQYSGYSGESKYLPYQFNGERKYDDDEIFELEGPSQSNSTGEVTLTLKPAYSKIDATTPNQEIPCMISLKAPQSETEDRRLGMDLICVIDISGSMMGNKIAQVISTLRFMVDLLGDKDRVCLIVFDHRAFRLCPLTRVTSTGRDYLLNIINNISVLMHNEIEEGLRTALIVLRDRRLVNHVTSVLLLSDGVDSINDARIQYLKGKSEEFGLSGYSINTFGYGADHDARILKSIADTNDGYFYYVERDEEIDSAFANCIGELATLVADKPRVRILTQPCAVNFALTKIYSDTGDNEFCMPALLSSSQKDSIFVITVDPSGQEEEIVPIKVRVTLNMAKSGQEVVLEQEMKIVMSTDSNEIEVDQEVIVNFYRVKGAEILKEIAALADRNMFEQAKELSLKGAEELKNCVVKDHPIVQTLCTDIENARQRASSQMEWSRGGQAEVKSLTTNHAQQRAAVNSLQYMNCVQEKYVSKAKKR